MHANLTNTTILHEPAEQYHRQAKDNLSSHQLGDFRRCPWLYRKKKLGLIPDEDRPAYLLGRGLHTLVLEGRDRFEAEYAVGGPINPKTGEMFGAATKAFAEWAAAQGKPVLTVAQFDLIENMADGVWANGIAVDLLSEGVAEGVVRTEYCGLPCQTRMDWFDPHRGVLDLKSCDDLTWFEADAKRYGLPQELPLDWDTLKVLRLLREAGGQMARRELMRLMHAKAGDFDQILGTLTVRVRGSR